VTAGAVEWAAERAAETAEAAERTTERAAAPTAVTAAAAAARAAERAAAKSAALAAPAEKSSSAGGDGTATAEGGMQVGQAFTPAARHADAAPPAAPVAIGRPGGAVLPAEAFVTFPAARPPSIARAPELLRFSRRQRPLSRW
jgi:hypothetical protein